MFSHHNGVVTDLADSGETLASGGEGGGNPLSQTGLQGEQKSFSHGQGGKPQGDDSEASTSKSRDQLQAKRGDAKANLKRAAAQAKSRYDKRRRRATEYKVGDLVLWRGSATGRVDAKVSHKLVNKYDGPYRVAKAMPNDRYLIEAIKGVKGYKRFHATVAVDSLRRYPCMGSKWRDRSEDGVNVGDRRVRGECDENDSDDESGAEVDRLDLLDLLES